MNMSKENLVIGRKDFMSYIKSIRFRFNKEKKVILVARGKNIIKSFDLAEATKNKFLKEMNIFYGKIEPSTENFEKDGINHFVTAIKIELLRKQ